jgi:3'(2'),5'-bisphosphate nucleotidase
LLRLDGKIQVVSEEDCQGHPVPSSNVYWLVDPLDGTLGYLRRDGQFTVNIALVRKGDVLAGVIHVPDSDTVYCAVRGKGSSRENADGVMNLEPSLAGGPLSAVLTNTSHSGRMRDFLNRNGISRSVKSSSSLKICYVAERKADIYPRFGRTALWDTAAGAVIAREAGCVVENIHGRPLRYDPSTGIYHYGFMVYDPARINPVIPNRI